MLNHILMLMSPKTPAYNTITAGTPAVYESAAATYTGTCALSSSKILSVYRDGGNSSYGTACVLDVSGAVVTPATPAVIASSAMTYLSVAMLSSTKAIVVYSDGGNSSYATACILDISGSTVTPGTPAVIASSAASYLSVAALSATKAIVCYRDIGNSDYGTACILDVSGSTITPATPAVFESALSYYISVAALSATKAIVVYADNGNTDKGTACILDVATSTITPATPAIYNAASSIYNSVTPMSATQALVVYRDGGNTNKGTACVLDIATSTITPGAEAVFNNAATSRISVSVAAVSSTKAVVCYLDDVAVAGQACVLNIASSVVTPQAETAFDATTPVYIAVAALSISKLVVSYADNGNSEYGTACVLDLS